MSNFQDYAKYYDMLNQNKDYKLETDYIDSLVKKYSTQAHTVLELGSGTGTHAIKFSDKGYSVHGIDISQEMVDISNRKLNELTGSVDNVQFTQGDIREINLSTTFDVVLSLFHVMSYQTENSDLEKVFMTAHQHLNQEGIFLFDFWHGPGVLTDQPTVRVKRVEEGNVKVYRVAEPVMHCDKNRVDVHYEILIMNEQTKEYLSINEIHSMRYLFIPELRLIAAKCGFEFINAYEYLTTNELSYQSWNGCILFKKVES